MTSSSFPFEAAVKSSWFFLLHSPFELAEDGKIAVNRKIIVIIIGIFMMNPIIILGQTRGVDLLIDKEMIFFCFAALQIMNNEQTTCCLIAGSLLGFHNCGYRFSDFLKKLKIKVLLYFVLSSKTVGEKIGIFQNLWVQLYRLLPL